MAALIDKCGTIKHYPLAMFQNVISKITRSSVAGNMDNIIPFSYSDSAMTSENKKNRRSTFRIQMKELCLSLKTKYDSLFNIRSKRPAFVLNI